MRFFLIFAPESPCDIVPFSLGTLCILYKNKQLLDSKSVIHVHVILNYCACDSKHDRYVIVHCEGFNNHRNGQAVLYKKILVCTTSLESSNLKV